MRTQQAAAWHSNALSALLMPTNTLRADEVPTFSRAESPLVYIRLFACKPAQLMLRSD